MGSTLTTFTGLALGTEVNGLTVDAAVGPGGGILFQYSLGNGRVASGWDRILRTTSTSRHRVQPRGQQLRGVDHDVSLVGRYIRVWLRPSHGNRHRFSTARHSLSSMELHRSGRFPTPRRLTRRFREDSRESGAHSHSTGSRSPSTVFWRLPSLSIMFDEVPQLPATGVRRSRANDPHSAWHRGAGTDSCARPSQMVGGQGCTNPNRAFLNVLRRTSEPHHADVHAPVQAADKRLQQEGREPRSAVAQYFMWYNFGRPDAARDAR